MSKVKIVVVEDELLIADHICDLLEEIGYEVFEPAISYTEAIQTIEQHQPDLILIDIQITGKKDGIELAEKVNESYKIPIIFLTSNADYHTVNRAKTTNPAAYLVKPFNNKDLYAAIEIALHNFKKKENGDREGFVIKQALFIRQKNTFIKLKFEDILFIKSDHVYVEIFTEDKHKYLVRNSLGNILKKLDDRFMQVHRSYVVNLKYLDSIQEKQLKINGFDIPISKQYKSKLLNKIAIS